MLLLDAAGKERVRLEGYLPNHDFMAALKNGLGCIAFVQKKYADAERWYGDVIAQFGDSHFAPEAMAGCGALQDDQRSHGAGQSCRGASNHLPVQRMGEQGDSVAALEKKQRKCVMVSSFWVSLGSLDHGHAGSHDNERVCRRS